ncbi:MAG: SpoIVB peptidase S55 domain-containing protein, partial [Euzebya sp.]
MTELFRTRTALLAAVALFFGLIVPGASAQTPDCGPIVRTSQVTRGMIGEGLTVVQGTTPETFGVEVLGVLKNGIGVGRDMIIVDVDAPFIDEVGGIWQGMSGSPVYVDGRLLGSVSFGLAFTSSSIGGLTPAENLVDLVSLGEGASFAADQPAAQQATVTGPLAAEIQRRVGGDSAAFTQQGVQLRQLPLPLSVSGLASSRLDSLEDVMAEHGQSMTAYAGSSAEYRQVQTTGSAPEPGENLAVAQSLGDLTMAAVGTATLECDGQVIGFGHPFTFAGPTIAGGALADAITIVPDHVGAPFKLANIGRLFGTVDEDRLEGVRADVGNFPRRIPVTSTVQDLDLGTSREGRTDVITPDALPFAAAFHL